MATLNRAAIQSNAARAAEEFRRGLIEGTAVNQETRTPPQREEMEEDEDDYEEAMEMDTEETQHRAPRNEAELAEAILLDLETNPNNTEIRGYAKRLIKKMYINNGGLPFNTANVLPHDLDALTDKELSNILENMVIHTIRNKHDMLVGKAVNIISNITYCVTTITGNPVGKELIDDLNSDDMLRQSMVEVFLGRALQVNPLITFLVSGASHCSNVAVRYIDGKLAKYRAAAAAREARPIPDGSQQSFTGQRQEEGATSSSAHPQ